MPARCGRRDPAWTAICSPVGLRLCTGGRRTVARAAPTSSADCMRVRMVLFLSIVHERGGDQRIVAAAPEGKKKSQPIPSSRRTGKGINVVPASRDHAPNSRLLHVCRLRCRAGRGAVRRAQNPASADREPSACVSASGPDVVPPARTAPRAALLVVRRSVERTARSTRRSCCSRRDRAGGALRARAEDLRQDDGRRAARLGARRRAGATSRRPWSPARHIGRLRRVEILGRLNANASRRASPARRRAAPTGPWRIARTARQRFGAARAAGNAAMTALRTITSVAALWSASRIARTRSVRTAPLVQRPTPRAARWPVRRAARRRVCRLAAPTRRGARRPAIAPPDTARSAIDTVITLNITDRTWTRDSVTAGVAIRSGRRRGSAPRALARVCRRECRSCTCDRHATQRARADSFSGRPECCSSGSARRQVVPTPPAGPPRR